MAEKSSISDNDANVELLYARPAWSCETEYWDRFVVSFGKKRKLHRIIIIHCNFDPNICGKEVPANMSVTKKNGKDVLNWFKSRKDVDGLTSEAIALLRCCSILSVPAIRIVDHTEEIDPTYQTIDLSHENIVPSGAIPSEAASSALLSRGLSHYQNLDVYEAANCFSSVLLRDNNNNDCLFNLGVIIQNFGIARLAVQFIARHVFLNPNDATSHNILGVSLYAHEPDAVISAYRDICDQDPSNLRAVHRLAVLTSSSSSLSCADPRYVSLVYDDMAKNFESKLVEHLGYRVPWMMKEVIEARFKHSGDVVDDVRVELKLLDLGCGTGLVGQNIHQYCKILVGVDISQQMVELTRATGLYKVTNCGDIHEAIVSISTAGSELNTLIRQAGQMDELSGIEFDIVTAADTFIYVGDLRRIFELVRSVLVSNGLFFFSTEREESMDGFVLKGTGRFGHSVGYVEALALANGFRLEMNRDIVVRKEGSSDVNGNLFLLVKS